MKRETPKCLTCLLMMLRLNAKPADYEQASELITEVYWMGYREGNEDAKLLGMLADKKEDER